MNRSLIFLSCLFLLGAGASKPVSIDELKARLAALPESGKTSQKARWNTDLGTALYNGGRMEEAAAAFEVALTYEPDREQRRYIYLYLGKSYESSHRLDKALPAYEEALSYDLKNWRRQRDVGQLYEQVHLYASAIRCYKEADRLSPNEPEVAFALGRTWRKLGLYHDAEQALEKAQSLGQDRNALDEELSYVYEGQGRFSESLQAWERRTAPSSSVGDAARLVYLGVMAGDAPAAKRGIGVLKARKASHETIVFYENLAELASAGPDASLARTSKNPAISSLIPSLTSEAPLP